MPKLLSEDQVEAYRRDGYVFPVRVMPEAQALGVRAALEAHERRAGAPLQGKWRVKTHLLFTWADRVVHHPAILDAVEDLIGPNILCPMLNFVVYAIRAIATAATATCPQGRGARRPSAISPVDMSTRTAGTTGS